MTFFLMMMAAGAVTAQAERSIAGTWSVESEVMGNTGSAVCTLTQEGSKVTGKCTSEGIDRPVTGDVTGQKFTFQHPSEYNGEALTLVYSGTFDSDTTLSGALTVKPYEVSGTFKAKKGAAQAASQDQATPFSGRWLIHLNIIGRQGDQDCTFTQKDKELTGTCKSYDAGGDIEGTVDGNKVKWLLKRDTGSTGNLNFSGTTSADGTIKGTVDVPAYNVNGEFTAIRAPAGQPPLS